MLIRIRKNRSFASREPLTRPAPRTLSATSTFNGIYLRPNLGNGGAVPAQGPYCSSPDIWIAGLTPIANFQTALATAQSYATASQGNVYSGQSNCIYVRGDNGATAAKSVNVTLYYSPSGVIQQPSKWQNNVIPSDTGRNQGNILNLAPGSVGVCDATFVWQNPQPPPPGSDHYCLFAQFNDANNSNPFPNVESPLDMGALIMNNLGWGWRNTSMVPCEANFSYTEPLNIPDNYPATAPYSIYVTPVGFVGWQVEFFCSRTDAQGHPIQLKRATIVQDGQMLGVHNVMLDAGFQSLITVNLYGSGTPPSGATVPLSCNYITSSGSELREALARGLIDAGFMYRLRRAIPDIDITPQAWILQGSYSCTTSNHPAVRDWWTRR